MPFSSGQRGFTYWFMLVIVVVGALVAGGTVTVWHTIEKREKELELVFIGDEFRRAIRSYYLATPGNVKVWPQSIDELVEDRRFPMPRRHLRRHYRDPITGSDAWGEVRLPGIGTLQGVFSLSAGEPLTRPLLSWQGGDFTESRSYQDWKFVYLGVG